MIITGKPRSSARQLGLYLSSQGKNERVQLLEVRGTIAQDPLGALLEMDAYAAGTRCEKAIYHAMISPAPGYELTAEQWLEAADALERELGLNGHARVVVLHTHHDRQHAHIAFSRIDLEKMRAVPDSHNYRRHEVVARELERRFGHERVQGAHHERDGIKRPDRTPSLPERRQEERTGIRGKDVKAEVTALFRGSDNAVAFQAALEDAGYVLAKGDRRDFVIIDRAGGVHSLARRIDGLKAAGLREFMSPLQRDAFPTVGQAQEIQAGRVRGERTSADDMAWEDELAQGAIEKDRRQREEAADLKRRRREAYLEDRLEAAYAKSDDYVSQSSTALRDHKRRQKRIERLLTAAQEEHELERGGDGQQYEVPGQGRSRSR